MPGRNLAKPFSIAGFILGEIYMLLLCLAPYRKGPPVPLTLPMPPLELSNLPPGSPIPPDVLALKIAVSAIFFGPFGALVGLGVGLLLGALLSQLLPRRNSAPPAAAAPLSNAKARADSETPKNQASL